MSTEAFKPQAESKGRLSQHFDAQAENGAHDWANDQGPTQKEILDKEIWDYGMKSGGAELSLGHMARTSENKAMRKRYLLENDDLHSYIKRIQDTVLDIQNMIERLKKYYNDLEAAEAKLKEIDEIIADKDLPAAKAFLQKQKDSGDPALILYMQDHGIENIEDMSAAQTWEAIDHMQVDTKLTIETLKQTIAEISEGVEHKIQDIKNLDPNWRDHPEVLKHIEEATQELEAVKARAIEDGAIRQEEEYNIVERQIREDNDYALLHKKLKSSEHIEDAELAKQSSEDNLDDLFADYEDDTSAGYRDDLKGTLTAEFSQAHDNVAKISNSPNSKTEISPEKIALPPSP